MFTCKTPPNTPVHLVTTLALAVAGLGLTACPGGDPGGDPAVTLEPSEELDTSIDGQCTETCPTCLGNDALIVIGTPDHNQHKVDARAAERAATEQGFWFADPNQLTDAPVGKTQAQLALERLAKAPQPVRTLVVVIHGHGVSGALWFNDRSRIPYADLYAAIAKLDACQVYISNDTCHSGTMFDTMPREGVAKCLTVAASSAGDTPSSCTNGLSQAFTNRVFRGENLADALRAAALSPGVQSNRTPGQVRTIQNPSCSCDSDCLLWLPFGDDGYQGEQDEVEPEAMPLPEPEPVSDDCAGETEVGRCDGQTAMYCAEGELVQEDCEAEDAQCVFLTDQSRYGCLVTAPEPDNVCADVPPEGACIDGAAVYCNGDEAFIWDCAAEGLTCVTQGEVFCG